MLSPFHRNQDDDSSAPSVPQTLGDDEWWDLQAKAHEHEKRQQLPREVLQAQSAAATDRYHKRHQS